MKTTKTKAQGHARAHQRKEPCAARKYKELNHGDVARNDTKKVGSSIHENPTERARGGRRGKRRRKEKNTTTRDEPERKRFQVLKCGGGVGFAGVHPTSRAHQDIKIKKKTQSTPAPRAPPPGGGGERSPTKLASKCK